MGAGVPAVHVCEVMAPWVVTWGREKPKGRQPSGQLRPATRVPLSVTWGANELGQPSCDLLPRQVSAPALWSVTGTGTGTAAPGRGPGREMSILLGRWVLQGQTGERGAGPGCYLLQPSWERNLSKGPTKYLSGNAAPFHKYIMKIFLKQGNMVITTFNSENNGFHYWCCD